MAEYLEKFGFWGTGWAVAALLWVQNQKLQQKLFDLALSTTQTLTVLTERVTAAIKIGER